eukprot:5227637-Amphidinium_carterae.1
MIVWTVFDRSSLTTTVEALAVARANPSLESPSAAQHAERFGGHRSRNGTLRSDALHRTSIWHVQEATHRRIATNTVPKI